MGKMREPIKFIVEGVPITSGNSSASKGWRKRIEEAYCLKYNSRKDPGKINFRIFLRFILKDMNKDLDNLPKYVLDTLFNCDRTKEKSYDKKKPVYCHSCFSERDDKCVHKLILTKEKSDKEKEGVEIIIEEFQKKDGEMQKTKD